MGCGASRAGNAASPKSTYLQDALAKAATEYVAQRNHELTHSPSFNTVALQFNKLRDGLVRIKNILNEASGAAPGGTAELAWASLPEKAQALGIIGSSEHFTKMCATVPKKTPPLDYHGIVLLYLVLYIKDKEALAGAPDSCRTAINALWLALSHFPSVSEGKLQRRELAEAMLAGSRHKGAKAQRLTDKLFRALVWDKGGQSLQLDNFVRAIIDMVDEEYGDEDEGEASVYDPNRSIR